MKKVIIIAIFIFTNIALADFKILIPTPSKIAPIIKPLGGGLVIEDTIPQSAYTDPIGSTFEFEGIEYLIVDRSMMLNAINVGSDKIISYNGKDYTFGFSPLTIFTGQVTNMFKMFEPESNIDFNADISHWDMSNVTIMSQMFYGAKNFDQLIGSWDVSNVTDMSNLTYYSNFNQDISGWDVSSVKNMSYIFMNSQRFNQPIGNWDVSSVTNMYAAFYSAINFNQDISGWDVSNVTDISTPTAIDIFKKYSGLSSENSPLF